MGLIAIEGMRFYAYHGAYEEEQLIGNEYVVDVRLEVNFSKAAAADDLYKTVNYETIFLICQAEMKKKHHLLETVADRIALGIKHQFRNAKNLVVRVKKMNPPLGGRVDWAFVESDGSNVTTCGRCDNAILCYKGGSCWCMQGVLPREKMAALKGKYGRCLCASCLKHYAF